MKKTEVNLNNIGDYGHDNLLKIAEKLDEAKCIVVKRIYDELGIPLINENGSKRPISHVFNDLHERNLSVELINQEGLFIIQAIHIKENGDRQIIIQCEVKFDYDSKKDFLNLKERWIRI